MRNNKRPIHRDEYRNPRRIPFMLKMKIIALSEIFSIGVVLVIISLTAYISHPLKFYFVDKTIINGGHTVMGRVYDISDTGNNLQGKPIYKIYYIYGVDTQKYNGIGYYPFPLDLGLDVKVIFDPTEPGRSVLAIQKDYWSFGNLSFSIVLALLGFAFVFMDLMKTLKSIRLLKYGFVAQGRFVKKWRQSSSLFRNDLYKLMFEFETVDGKKCPAYVWSRDLRRLTDEKFEKIIYDPNYPEDCRLVDALPINARKYVTKFISFFKHLKK